MVNQQLTNNNNKNEWWRFFTGGIGSGYSSQMGQEGDANIGSGLINVSKKETRVSEQNSLETSDSRDYSTSSIYSPTSVRNLTTTNAPTLVFNSPNSDVSGANLDIAASPEVSPVVQTKKEALVSQAATQSASQDNGLDLTKVALYGTVALIIVILISGGKKVVNMIPQVKTVKAVVKKVTKKSKAKENKRG